MKDIRTWLIIGLAAVIAFLLLFQRSPADPDKIIYEDSVKTLQAHKRILSASIDSLVKTSVIRQKSDSSKLAASLREISRLRAKATTAVQNIPVRVMEEYPEVPIALAYLDSVNQKQAVLIDTLKSQVEFERGVREQLTSLHYDQSKIETNLFELCELRNIQLQEMNDRLRKKAKGKGLLFGLGFGLGWLARSGADRL